MSLTVRQCGLISALLTLVPHATSVCFAELTTDNRVLTMTEPEFEKWAARWLCAVGELTLVVSFVSGGCRRASCLRWTT